MSTYTVIEMSVPDLDSIDKLPTEDKIRKLFAKHTDYSFDDFDGADDSDLSIFDEPAISEPRRSFGWHRKWSTEGVDTFLEKISKKFPGTTAKAWVEWDSHDADEPGAEGWSYSEGKLVETMTMDQVWSPATPDPRLKPWVVVEGGLVQYQSGDWNAAIVTVIDLDFLKDASPLDRETAVTAWSDLHLVDEVIRMKTSDGTGSFDLPRVAAAIRSELPESEWPEGLEPANA